MPCKGCGCHDRGKTQCIVCEAKWCSSCLENGAQRRTSGWKCNECVGTPHKKDVDPNALTNDGTSYYESLVKLRALGHNITDWNRNDFWVRDLVYKFEHGY